MYERDEQRKMEEIVDNIMTEYEILKHFKCSSLTGENIKAIFDEVLFYAVKVK